MIICIFILRFSSGIDENEAKIIATDIILEKGYNNACGGRFEKYMILNRDNPLIVSGIDTAWYSFESNNWRCTLFIYVYKYWGGYKYALDPH